MSDRRVHFGGLVLLIVSCLVACPEPTADSGANKKETIRKSFMALDSQDYDSLTELVAGDIVLGDRRIGRQGAFDVIRGFYDAFPDYTHVIDEMIVEGDVSR